jgi:hypothetical protein
LSPYSAVPADAMSEVQTFRSQVNGSYSEGVQFVQKVQIVQTPSFILPRNAGEERGGGIERSEAIKQLERFECSLH